MSSSTPPSSDPTRPADPTAPVVAAPDGGRDSVFDGWLAAHRGILFKVVHAHACEPADREDLFQEVALQVWRSVDAFRGQCSVPTWLYRVALNTALTWTRKEGRHQRGRRTL